MYIYTSKFFLHIHAHICIYIYIFIINYYHRAVVRPPGREPTSFSTPAEGLVRDPGPKTGPPGGVKKEGAAPRWV